MNNNPEFMLIGSITDDWANGGRYHALEKVQKAGITPGTFADDTRKRLFQALCEHASELTEPTGETFLSFLEAHYPHEKETLIQAYMDCADKGGCNTQTEHWIGELKRQHKNTELQRLCERFQRKAKDPETYGGADALVNAFQSALMEAFPLEGDASESLAEAQPAVSRNLHELIDKGAAAMKGLSTGFRRLDDTLFGLKAGEMIVVAARPSVGKTTLGMNIAVNAARKGHRVLVFSEEMPKEDLAMRILGGEAQIDQVKAIRTGKDGYTAVEKEQLHNQLNRTCEDLDSVLTNIFVAESNINDIAEVRAHARQLRREEGIELVVVDYLQLLQCEIVARQGRQLETARISSELKRMAKELKVPVIAISQLSRANEQRGDKNEKPKLSDLRDSGAIEQDADVVILIRRPAMIQNLRSNRETKDIVCLDIAKHRNGPIGEIAMRFRGEYYRYEDILDVNAYQKAIELCKLDNPVSFTDTEQQDIINDDF